MIYVLIPVAFALTQTTLDLNIDENVTFKAGAESNLDPNAGTTKAEEADGTIYGLPEEPEEPEEQSATLTCPYSYKNNLWGAEEGTLCLYDEMRKSGFEMKTANAPRIPCKRNFHCKSKKCDKASGFCTKPWKGTHGMTCSEDKECLSSLCEYRELSRQATVSTRTCGRKKLPYHYMAKELRTQIDSLFSRNDEHPDTENEDVWEYRMSVPYIHAHMTAKVSLAINTKSKVAMFAFKVDKFVLMSKPRQEEYQTLYDKIHAGFVQPNIGAWGEGDDFDIILTGREKGGVMPFLARKKLDKEFPDAAKWKYIVLVHEPPTSGKAGGFPTEQFKKDYEHMDAACSSTRIYVTTFRGKTKEKYENKFICSANEKWKSIQATDSKWRTALIVSAGAPVLCFFSGECWLAVLFNIVTGGIFIPPAGLVGLVIWLNHYRKYHNKNKHLKVFGNKSKPRKQKPPQI